MADFVAKRGYRLVAEKEGRMLVVEGNIDVDHHIHLLRTAVEDSLVEVDTPVDRKRRMGRTVLAAVVAGLAVVAVGADLGVRMVVVHLV